MKWALARTLRAAGYPKASSGRRMRRSHGDVVGAGDAPKCGDFGVGPADAVRMVPRSERPPLLAILASASCEQRLMRPLAIHDRRRSSTVSQGSWGTPSIVPPAFRPISGTELWSSAELHDPQAQGSGPSAIRIAQELKPGAGVAAASSGLVGRRRRRQRCRHGFSQERRSRPGTEPSSSG